MTEGLSEEGREGGKKEERRRGEGGKMR
jgi:hypothetical protein